MPVHEIRHPLIRHKLGIMRRADLSTKSFRELSQEVGALLTYEATKDFPLESSVAEGWCGPVQVEKIAGKKVTVVPILRAGIGMLDGVLSLIPAAYGMYIYMSARLGSGPRDGLMCVVKRRAARIPVGGVRVILEGCALTLGWLLGGAVGLGTIILVCLSGPVMQVIFKLHKFDVRELRNETIPETISAVRGALAKKT